MANNKAIDSESANLRMLISRGDDLVNMYKAKLDKSKVASHKQLNTLLKERIESYQKAHIQSLQTFYSKSFKYMNDVLNDLNSEVDQSKKEFNDSLFHFQNDIKLALQDKERELQNLLAKQKKEHEEKMGEIQKEIDEVTKSSQERIQEESQRITDHFEKQLKAKKDAYEMIVAAIVKAKSELDTAVAERTAAISDVVNRNNQILEEHASKLTELAVQYSSQIDNLQRALDDLKKKQNELGPELELIWIQRKHDLTEQFKAEDKQIQENIENQQQLIPKLDESIREVVSEIETKKIENALLLENRIKELDEQLRKVIQDRQPSIERAHNEIVASYEEKLAKLNERLKSLRDTIEKDANDFQNRINEKLENHQDRMNKLREENQKAIEEVQEQIDETNRQIEETKQQWVKEKEDINESYDRDIRDVSTKELKDDKYFEAKVAALTKELHQVLMENQAMAEQATFLDETEAEVNSKQDSYREKEEQISARLSSELSVQVQERVQEKMRPLKEKHEQERLRLLNDAYNLEEQEMGLQKLIATRNSSNRSSTSSASSINLRSSAVFSSSSFLNAQVDKWRGDYFVETKNLKQEEADALKDLDKCKVEFQEAMNKTVRLRDALKESTSRYETALAEAKTKSGEELTALRTLVEQKEKEIVELERTFEENEKEVRKKIRQIENAEEKLTKLRNQLAAEKGKIKEVIKKEYQPLIQNEQRKSEIMVSALEKLRNELELSLEYMKHDLYCVETSNAAMEEGLAAETDQLVEQLRAQLKSKLEKEEEVVVTEMSNIEMSKLEEVNQKVVELEEEVEKLQKEKQRQIDEAQNSYKAQITELNDHCFQIMSESSEKKQIIRELRSRKCELCPVLDKNIHKLEKLLVKLQYHDRDLLLDGKNKKDMLQKFKNTKPKLPPLPAQRI